jgi:hypothetical protein
LPELLKRYRPTEEEPVVPEAPTSNGKGKGKAATVAEEEDDEEMAYAGGKSLMNATMSVVPLTLDRGPG